jgi:hypothetical protein
MAVRVTSDPLALFFVHHLIVERFTGSTAYGDTFAAEATVPGFVSDDNHLVLDSNGEQVVASTRVALPATVAAVPVGSRVTLPAAFGSRESVVVAASIGDAGPLPLPAHQEISLR